MYLCVSTSQSGSCPAGKRCTSSYYQYGTLFEARIWLDIAMCLTVARVGPMKLRQRSDMSIRHVATSRHVEVDMSDVSARHGDASDVSHKSRGSPPVGAAARRTCRRDAATWRTRRTRRARGASRPASDAARRIRRTRRARPATDPSHGYARVGRDRRRRPSEPVGRVGTTPDMALIGVHAWTPWTPL